MKFTVERPVEIEIKWVKVSVPVRYDDEDIPYDFPHRNGDMWTVLIDIETGKIQDWPKLKVNVYMKVVDGGSYFLLGENREILAAIEEDYVPRIIPGEYGDYIDFKIDEDGTITNWPRNFDVSTWCFN